MRLEQTYQFIRGVPLELEELRIDLEYQLRVWAESGYCWDQSTNHRVLRTFDIDLY